MSAADPVETRMRIDPSKLLRKLEPPVRPAAAPNSGVRGRAPLESASFGDLLGLVSTGAIESGRAVSLPRDLPDPLTDEQQRRLAAAADLAEANGVETALMLIDGRGLLMDVPERAVTSEPTAADATQLVAVEAAVFVAGEEDGAGTARPPFPGQGVVPPAVVARLLAATSDRAAGERETSMDPAAPRPADG